MLVCLFATVGIAAPEFAVLMRWRFALVTLRIGTMLPVFTVSVLLVVLVLVLFPMSQNRRLQLR